MFRQGLLGTSLGRLALTARDLVDLARSSRENIGTTANDQLADYLVARLCARRFVDVGAHIGSIISAVQAHCPDAHITAFEPIPRKAERLSHKFSKVDVIACALGDQEGEASFFIDPAASGYSSLARSTATMQEIIVPVKRLDSLVQDPDVIKIDVEGAELGVLKGSENLTTRPVFLFESGPSEVLGYTKMQLWRWFDDRQYGVFAPNRIAHQAAPMTYEVFLDSHQYPRWTTNYFAVPLERIAAVRDRARKILNLER